MVTQMATVAKRNSTLVKSSSPFLLQVTETTWVLSVGDLDLIKLFFSQLQFWNSWRAEWSRSTISWKWYLGAFLGCVVSRKLPIELR